MDRVTVFRDVDSGEFRWTRRGEAGEYLATSDDTYPDLDSALDAAREIHPGLPVRAVRTPEPPAAAPLAPGEGDVCDEAGEVDTAAAAAEQLMEIAAHDEGPPCR